MTSAKLIVSSAASGCVWAWIAATLLDRAVAWPVWGGILASPIIGALMGMLSVEFRRRPLVGQIFLALLSLYAATALFGFAIGIADIALGVNAGPGWHRNPSAVVIQAVMIVLWGLTFTGYLAFLWPLAWANHTLVARVSQRGRNTAHSSSSNESTRWLG